MSVCDEVDRLVFGSTVIEGDKRYHGSKLYVNVTGNNTSWNDWEAYEERGDGA